MILSAKMVQEYESLYRTCQILPQWLNAVELVMDKILKNKDRYVKVQEATNVPWYIVGIIHGLECGFDFSTHLHNGDPLTMKTIHVPKGRPRGGRAPYKWEESAKDALLGRKTPEVWDIPNTLFFLEGYNGWGYRKTDINSPYLWSFTNHYDKGKFVQDGVYNPNARSKQCGAVAILRRLEERGLITQTLPGAISYGDESSRVIALQQYLNLQGATLREDGVAGPLTSAAFHTVFGMYLKGDPRG